MQLLQAHLACLLSNVGQLPHHHRLEGLCGVTARLRLQFAVAEQLNVVVAFGIPLPHKLVLLGHQSRRGLNIADPNGHPVVCQPARSAAGKASHAGGSYRRRVVTSENIEERVLAARTQCGLAEVARDQLAMLKTYVAIARAHLHVFGVALLLDLEVGQYSRPVIGTKQKGKQLLPCPQLKRLENRRWGQVDLLACVAHECDGKAELSAIQKKVLSSHQIRRC
mmetsp:Transcript_53971/g.89825  ORF Transcript_53971/g.89825 Transcript_53971/m.89825 type:complete len:223 (-) Transcript_53971:94-762(-)